MRRSLASHGSKEAGLDSHFGALPRKRGLALLPKVRSECGVKVARFRIDRVPDGVPLVAGYDAAV
jgi:hypothetical protein